MKAWKSHHRKLCKTWPRFSARFEFTSISEQMQTDSLLLSRTIIEHFSSINTTASSTSTSLPPLSPNMEILLSLLPHPSPGKVPPLPKSVTSTPHPTDSTKSLANELWIRTPNNHWVIYGSELTPVAHGIYPTASRAFNHSCLPSAIPVYVYGNEGAEMQVRALRDLQAGEEVGLNQLSNLNSCQRQLRIPLKDHCALHRPSATLPPKASVT